MTEPFPWVDPSYFEEDSAERLARRFFDACEGPKRRARTDRLLRIAARSSLRGTMRYSLMNKIVLSRLGKLTGVDARAQRLQLVSAHLLGMAYIRYVFKLEPIASMPIDELIALSVPVLTHYLADCPPVDRPAVDPCVFSGDASLPRTCALCAPAYRRATISPTRIPAP